MKRFPLVLVAALAVALCSSSARAETIVYNPQTAFSSSNPSGVWTYGVLDTTNSNPATNLTPFSNYSAGNDSTPGVNVWSNDPSGPFPGIFNNTNSSTSTVYTTIAIPGNTLVLHPPNNADQADLRFTAPTNMLIDIAGKFSASDTSGTTSDVHVYVNGTAQFNSTVTGTAGNGATSFSGGPLFLTAGQTVDFTVGDGGNGYNNDGTRLVASITAVPEPSSIALACIAGLGLLVIGGKRARRQA
jgi:hypothetical protein